MAGEFSAYRKEKINTKLALVGFITIYGNSKKGGYKYSLWYKKVYTKSYLPLVVLMFNLFP